MNDWFGSNRYFPKHFLQATVYLATVAAAVIEDGCAGAEQAIAEGALGGARQVGAAQRGLVAENGRRFHDLARYWLKGEVSRSEHSVPCARRGLTTPARPWYC